MMRPYQHSDYPIISSWGKVPPTGFFPVDTSFVYESEGRPLLFVSLYLTNTKDVCLVEHFIGDPERKGAERRLATQTVQAFLESYARDRGYARLLCFTNVDSLKAHYKGLGYSETSAGHSIFVKEVL